MAGVHSAPSAWMLVLPPAVAALAVAVGLRLGAGASSVHTAVVYGAPPSARGLAWQVVARTEDGATREPLAGVDLEVEGTRAGRVERWSGRTDPDGVAEVRLGLPAADAVALRVRAGDEVLAGGEAAPPPAIERAAAPAPVWMPFARREGSLRLDVAVVGQRVAPGFAARVVVRATDARTREPVPGVEVEAEPDPSAEARGPARTDGQGWARLDVTPVGLAISLALSARSPGGLQGRWQGGLDASPGAPDVRTRLRWSTDEPVAVTVIAPTPRDREYVEIEDERGGRVWAGVVPLERGAGATPVGGVEVGALPPGLYWAEAGSGPDGAVTLAPGTATRPFFVAASDEAALALGQDAVGCAPPRDARETAGALEPCLALAAARPAARWVALDGAVARRERDARQRARGLAVAVGAVLAAALLELVLLLRSAAVARTAALAGLPVPANGAGDAPRACPGGGAWNVAVAVLVGLLGFALLAAFLTRL
jgi:hypothetical protein